MNVPNRPEGSVHASRNSIVDIARYWGAVAEMSVWGTWTRFFVLGMLPPETEKGK